MVTTISYYDIAMDPKVIDQELFDSEISNLADGLSRLFGDRTSKEYENLIKKKRNKGSQYVRLKER